MGEFIYFAAVQRIDAAGADIPVIAKTNGTCHKGDILFVSNENVRFYGIVQACFSTYETSEETAFMEAVYGEPFRVEKRYAEGLL